MFVENPLTNPFFCSKISYLKEQSFKMPIYEYKCCACPNKFEKIQKLGDPAVSVCPLCGGSVTKCYSVPAISFKGKGFYVTDYPSKNKGSVASIEGSGEKKPEVKKDVASQSGGQKV
jgi:putative FmdB family regulatory protein